MYGEVSATGSLTHATFKSSETQACGMRDFQSSQLEDNYLQTYFHIYIGVPASQCDRSITHTLLGTILFTCLDSHESPDTIF